MGNVLELDELSLQNVHGMKSPTSQLLQAHFPSSVCATFAGPRFVSLMFEEFVYSYNHCLSTIPHNYPSQPGTNENRDRRTAGIRKSKCTIRWKHNSVRVTFTPNRGASTSSRQHFIETAGLLHSSVFLMLLPLHPNT